MIINEDRVEIHGPFLMQKIRKEGIPVAGRKPKPTALKKLEGNPGKRKLNTKEPIPAKGMPNCPEWLLPEARKIEGKNLTILWRCRYDREERTALVAEIHINTE